MILRVMHYSIDQILNFLAVVETGSFSSAAKARKKAQPAMTYSIQNLEAQLNIQLFDRTEYRPKLTEAGRRLLPFAKRFAEDANTIEMQAKGLVAGIEKELSIVGDYIFPNEIMVDLINKIQEQFPTVQIVYYNDVLDRVTDYIIDGRCGLAILALYGNMPPIINRVQISTINLYIVASKNHPLSKGDVELTEDELRKYIQIVLTDSSGQIGLRDYAVLGGSFVKVSELSTMGAIVKSGLGFGILPHHVIEKELENGELVKLQCNSVNPNGYIEVPMYLAWRSDKPLGPAATFVAEYFKQIMV